MIEFNKPFLTGKESQYINQAHLNGQLSGDGLFTKECSKWLSELTGACSALITHSCTAALEMAAILLDAKSGDEVIMPSYTFVSTANAFALRGAIPVFVDVREDTLNIDEGLIESAITPRTKAIVPVHYAGVPCEMNTIDNIARKYGLFVVEDAAQGLLSTYEGRPLGGIGDLGCFSFHETKNINCGEGGALIVNNESMSARAEIIREKGTNRSQFSRGTIDKYTWVDIGSSYLPGEIVSAFLWAQMEEAVRITSVRLKIWDIYYSSFASLEQSGRLRRPCVPANCSHNAHMFYLILKDQYDRNSFINHMRRARINCVFHYVPLHSAPAAARYSRTHADLVVTECISERLVRLPLWIGVEKHLQYIIEQAHRYFLKAD